MSVTLERQPAVAGRFYPDDADGLRDLIDGLIGDSGVESNPERVGAIVVPHAGYPFSAATAAHAFARVRGRYFRRVVLLGCSHHYRFQYGAIVTKGRFHTPLGPLEIAQDLAMAIEGIAGNAPLECHGPEHSLEVQLPFVHRALDAPMIVPVLFGARCNGWHAEFGRRLAPLLEATDLVLVSTDMSHFHSESVAQARDRASLDILLGGDVEDVIENAVAGNFDLCGAAAVAAGLACAQARGASHLELLDYRTSAAASGDTSRVVGYCAVTMEYAA